MKTVCFKHPEKEGPLLEGCLHLPEGAGPFPGAVICHPHPQFGGSMDVTLVAALAEGLAEAGWAALRFNFRGVGASEGTYDEGVGEVEDVEAAIAYLAAQPFVAGKGLALVGYSFGAWVGLEAAQRSERVAAVAAIGLPMWRMPEDWLGGFNRPKLFVAGERDMVCPVKELREFVVKLPGPTEVTILTRTDHYLAGREPQAVQEVIRFLRAHKEAS